MRAVSCAALLVVAACTDAGGGEPAPSPDGGDAGDDGGAECLDHGDEGPCRADVPDECPRGLSCTLPRRSCPDGERCCTLALACEERAGELPGGARCREDADCATGVCLSSDGGVCLRACASLPEDTCPESFHCALVGLTGGATVRACLGGTAEAPDPAGLVCRGDGDCEGGRICRIQQGTSMMPIGACQPRPDGVETDIGLACHPPGPVGEVYNEAWAGSDRCPERGVCAEQCDSSDGEPCTCGESAWLEGRCTSWRCTTPCITERDCPQRYVCSDTERGEHAPFYVSDQVFRICQLPVDALLEWGCWDELDCCRDGRQRDGSACCNFNSSRQVCEDPPVPVERTHCSVRASPGFTDRFRTVCLEPTGAGPGEPCTSDAGCTSGLCLADAAGGRACSSPCEARNDRCGELLPGSRCCPTAFTLGETQACVDACRFDCPEEPACAP